MNWVREFYSVTGTWWGDAEAGITERDHARAATLARLAGSGPKRVLDLGSSYGNTAAALALTGHDVIGVEISDRIDFAEQHVTTVAAAPDAGSLEFRKVDFYDIALDAPVDVVTYWNGFGVGDDADQRRLLRKIAAEWLSPGGCALIDIANPACWIGWVEDEEHRVANPAAGYPFEVSERTDYDPVRNRFIDTWWRTDDPATTWSQSCRCYAPADLALLLEGTGLRVATMEIDGTPFDVADVATSVHPLWSTHEYLVMLVRDGE